MINILFLLLLISCSAFSVKPGTKKKLIDNKLTGFWTDGNGSTVKIYCQGQFEYEKDYRVNNDPFNDESLAHFAGAHKKDQGGQVKELKDNKIYILPFGHSYKIDSFPKIVKNSLQMEFDGKKYWLKEDFNCPKR